MQATTLHKLVNHKTSSRWLVGILALLLGSHAVHAEPTVTNVRGGQQPDSTMVDVYYDLSSPAYVSLQVSTNSGSTWTVPVTTVTPSGSERMPAGKGHHILWNAGTDWPNQESKEVRFKVTASEVALEGDYMVIDLSGGPSASSYPVSYMSAPPSGGWTDEYKTTKLVMRRISAGTFTMGSPTSELGRQSNEAQRSVTLTKDYYMGVFQVTQRQWELVMGNKPSYFNNASYYATRPVEQVSYFDIRENATSNSAISPNWPQSSQVGASSFVGKLRERTGLPALDLPTEAQWERAARAGTGTALNSGKNLTSTSSCPNMSEVGRYQYNHPGGYSSSSTVSTDGGTAKVGSYLHNAWGLYDMHGNVYERCLDWHEAYHAATTDPAGAASVSDRVIRGGYWGSVARFCRSALRNYGYPDGRNGGVGFRLSRTLP